MNPLRYLFNRKQRRAFVDSSKGIHWAGEFWPWSRIAKHILIMGGTGSGKTYTGDQLVRAIMASGAPMLFNAVKPNDFERILANARRVGHGSRVVEITPSGPHRFRLLDSLLEPHGSASMAAQLMGKIGEVGQPTRGQGGDSKFWDVQGERCISSGITVCREVVGRVSIPDVHAVIRSSPVDLKAAEQEQWEESTDIGADGKPIKRGRCAELIVAGMRRGLNDSSLAFNNAATYLVTELPGGGDRQRGGVISNVANTLGRFLDEPYVTAFSTDTTLRPIDIDQNSLIGVLNDPVMKGLIPARRWQFAWTMEMQRYCLARDASKADLPVIIVRDEAGLVLNPSWDSEVQIVARSQKLAMVSLIQDISTLLNALGGESAKHEAYSFLSNHAGAKLLFGTENIDTSKWMSALIGMERQIMVSGGGGRRCEGGDFLAEALGVPAVNWSEQFQPIVRPEGFARLRTGQAYMVAEGGHRFLDLYEGKR